MTIVINLFGSAGAGKSTTALGLAYQLNLLGYSVQYVSEYAKSVVWEESFKKLNFQYYIFAKQMKSMDIVLNKNLDFIVTDSPLVLSLFYGAKYNTLIPYLPELILDQFKAMNNINIFLNRKHSYETLGRVQSEIESNQDSLDLKKLLENSNIEYTEIDTSKTIVNEILELLKLNKNGESQ